VIVTNDNPRRKSCCHRRADRSGLSSARRPVTVELDRRRAIEAADRRRSSGALILDRRKAGHETYQIIGTETLAFDDREVARGARAPAGEGGR
jgi:UDP-N-acetylmuramyl tripeptide synthase